MIFYGRHYIDNEDVKAVTIALKSSKLTQGKYLKKFQNKLKKKFGAKYCSVVSNGTAALYLAGKALSWKKNDIILTTPNSFLATANCILYNNATPDFVDIDRKTYNISLDKLEEKINKYLNKGVNIKSVVCVDYAGQPCDWEELKKLSNKYGFSLVNDNCHAVGALYKGKVDYALKYADIVTHSYHPVKNITTGEGGAVLTNNKFLYEKIERLKNHGLKKVILKSNISYSPWNFKMFELGYNFRISELQCALGISQLSKLNKFIRRRKDIAKLYNLNFKDCEEIQISAENKYNSHAYHLYPILINFKKLGLSKKRLFNIFHLKGFYPQVHYYPIHLQPFYKKNFNFKYGDFPNAESFFEQEISLPIFYGLKDKHISEISKTIKKFIYEK